MNGNEFLDKMELIDPVYIEAADAEPEKKKSVWIRWGAIAAYVLSLPVLWFSAGRPSRSWRTLLVWK